MKHQNGLTKGELYNYDIYCQNKMGSIFTSGR